MGLREKVALAAVAVIATRVLSSCCMPRVNCNCNRLNDINIVNEPNILRFPEVEYPSSSQVWDYYRFQNDYTNDLRSKVNDNIAVNTSQTRNLERDGKHKRKYKKIGRNTAGSAPACRGVALDPAPQPYCFKESRSFPDMDYPLSARDMWIPTYWSQHFDTGPDRIVAEQITSTKNPHKNSPLNCILNTCNTENKTTVKIMDYNINSKLLGGTSNSPKTIPKDFTNATQITDNSGTEAIQEDGSESTTTGQTTLEPQMMHVAPNQSELYGQGNLPLNNDKWSLLEAVAEIYSPQLTETLPVTLPMTISTEACMINNYLNTPPCGTTVPVMLDKHLEENTSVTVPAFTHTDTNDATTVSPLDCLTPPLPDLDKVSDKQVFKNTSDPRIEKEVPNKMPKEESTPSVIADVLYKSQSDDVVVMCTDNPNLSSVICLDGLNESWVFNSNNSYLTWESIPEYSDDWIIFVDDKNHTCGNRQEGRKTIDPENPTILCADNSTGNTDRTVSNNENTNANIAKVDKTPCIVKLFQESIAEPKSLDILNDIDDTITNDEGTNLIPQDSEAKGEACTEPPDDPAAVCPEHANGTWHTANDFCITHQPDF